MDKTKRATALESKPHTAGIEVRLAQDGAVELDRRERLAQPALRLLIPPNFGDRRRIAISELAIGNQRGAQNTNESQCDPLTLSIAANLNYDPVALFANFISLLGQAAR